MKQNMTDLLSGADAAELEGLIDLSEDARAPKSAVRRICRKVAKSDEPSGKTAFSARKKRLIAVAAIALLALAALGGVFALNRRSPKVPDVGELINDTGKGTPETDTVPPVDRTEHVMLSPVPDESDRVAGGKKVEVTGPIGYADRDIRKKIMFFESENAAYMMFLEGRPLYRYENGVFTKTGTVPPEAAYLSNAFADGYAYIKGEFSCIGGPERGLFRFDIRTGKLEKYVDCEESAVSVATVGKYVYYVTCDYTKRPPDWKYTLKRLDTETNGIELLLTSEDSVFGLREYEGDLFFSISSTGICRIGNGTEMRVYRSGENERVDAFTLSDGRLYVYFRKNTPEDGGELKRESVIRVYDLGGSVLGEKVFDTARGDARKETDRLYLGSYIDELTVYGGKVVSFDADAFYLEDIVSGEEKRIETPFFRDSANGNSYFVTDVSKTVYDGKLFFNVFDSFLEYSDGNLRYFTLG